VSNFGNSSEGNTAEQLITYLAEPQRKPILKCSPGLGIESRQKHRINAELRKSKFAFIRARIPVYGLSITQGWHPTRENQLQAFLPAAPKPLSHLKGHGIRLISALSGFSLYDTINPQSQRTVDLAPGRAGGCKRHG